MIRRGGTQSEIKADDVMMRTHVKGDIAEKVWLGEEDTACDAYSALE